MITSGKHVATAAGLGGTPTAIATVVLWEYHTGTELDSISATAIGSIGATVFGFLWYVVTALIIRQLRIDPYKEE